MNEQRAIDKANRRRGEASYGLRESETSCPRRARHDRQLARVASHRATRQIAREEERLGLEEAMPEPPDFDCSASCPSCSPTPEAEDVAALPAGCTYDGSVLDPPERTFTITAWHCSNQPASVRDEDCHLNLGMIVDRGETSGLVERVVLGDGRVQYPRACCSCGGVMESEEIVEFTLPEGAGFLPPERT